MIKYRSRKIKDKGHELTTAIKKNFESGIKPIDISKLFKISKQRNNYIIHHLKKKKRKRRTKLARNEKLILESEQKINP